MNAMDFTNPNDTSVFDSLRRRMMMPEPWTFSDAREEEKRRSDRMIDTLKHHWAEYLMEATELGLFMISACAFTVLLYHPASPVTNVIPDGIPRRLLMGIAM